MWYKATEECTGKISDNDPRAGSFTNQGRVNRISEIVLQFSEGFENVDQNVSIFREKNRRAINIR